MDLTTNGVVITDDIKFLQTTKENLMSSKEEDDKGSKETYYDELEEEQEKETGEIDQRETTNQVF
jgi:hypothetical protein